MRRKSERTAATKKAKASPEKKVEKVKRTRTRRTRKQSTSSENESGEESSPVQKVEADVPVETPSQNTVKEDSPEDTQVPVWQVKTAESSGDVGEIQKLKICLARPPSTPERVDRSPRSKRKHSRATSSSDTPSSEGVEEKKKSRHRSRRNLRQSIDDCENKNQDSQGDEEGESSVQAPENSDSEITQSSTQVISDETPMSTTNENNEEEVKAVEKSSEELAAVEPSSTATEESQSEGEKVKNNESQEDKQNKSSDADTTVASPKADNQDNQSEHSSPVKDRSDRRSVSVEKSEVLDIHHEDSKSESMEVLEIHEESKLTEHVEDGNAAVTVDEENAPAKKVSIKTQNKTDDNVSESANSTQNNSVPATNDNNVVEGTENSEMKRNRAVSTDSDKNKSENMNSKELERSDSTQSTQEEYVPNGTPFVLSRKRRWGARPKVTTQKSITISTDVLKEIIPDVKPTEFEEVIEEKKHRRVESDKVERPLLPKIVIDNSENVEKFRREQEDIEMVASKPREGNLTTNRKISIVKDNETVVGRPPSPPRNKQSNILYITNLVRPFTLPLLKNLLQRTGRIVENGFWIDRIKSKCFVEYENEDQAVETRHALHGVTWPVSNPKTLQVDFSNREAFDKAKNNEEADSAPVSAIPGTVEDWLREQDQKRERGELDKPWERKAVMREWDVGKNEKDKDNKDKLGRRDERPFDKRRHHTPERSPEPAKKFKKKEEEAPAKLLDDLFRKTKTTPCIYWLPLSAETIAIKEEQRRQHMAEHERRLQELSRRPHRRH